jgi:hypothetical protein
MAGDPGFVIRTFPFSQAEKQMPSTGLRFVGRSKDIDEWFDKIKSHGAQQSQEEEPEINNENVCTEIVQNCLYQSIVGPRLKTILEERHFPIDFRKSNVYETFHKLSKWLSIEPSRSLKLIELYKKHFPIPLTYDMYERLIYFENILDLAEAKVIYNSGYDDGQDSQSESSVVYHSSDGQSDGYASDDEYSTDSEVAFSSESDASSDMSAEGYLYELDGAPPASRLEDFDTRNDHAKIVQDHLGRVIMQAQARESRVAFGILIASLILGYMYF